MPPAIHSLNPPAGHHAHEVIATILQGKAFRMELIRSHQATSPPGFWYDQENPEWVALLKGTASLEFEDGTLHLGSGDHLLIPARLKHRVAFTSEDASWLALHFEPEPDHPPPCNDEANSP